MARILIADDDPILCEILKFRLESAGHIVQVARDGEQALEMVRGDRPELVVLDSMMPIISGPDVMAAMKADPELAEIPVVILTSRDGEADIIAGLKGGASEYLTKPFIPQELLLRISALVEA